jgi:hypothetical protein
MSRTESRAVTSAAVSPVTTRRRLLEGTAGLALLSGLSGCLGPLQSYAARPVVLPAETADQRGYVEVHAAEVPLQFSPVPVLGPLVEARSHVRVYATVGAAGLDGLPRTDDAASGSDSGSGSEASPPDGGSESDRNVDGDALVPTGADAATLVTFASPEADVAGRPANPLSWTGVRDVVSDLADSQLVREAGVEGLTWAEAPRHVGSTPGRLLGVDTAVESFLGEMTDDTGRTTSVAVHAASTTVDGTVALALGLRGAGSAARSASNRTSDEPTATADPGALGVGDFLAVCERLVFAAAPGERGDASS